MDEQSLRSILGRVGIRLEGRANHNGWIEFKCPLAPFTHRNKHDARPSAAAVINEHGKSSFVCKACHHKGSISRLVQLLADFRKDNNIRPLMLEADRADADARIAAPLPEWEQEIDTGPEPLDWSAYGDIYPQADGFDLAIEYLRERGISMETARSLDLRWDERQRRVLFPVYDRDNNLYGYTGRAIDPGIKPKIKDYYGLPKKYLILGEHRWEDGKPVIIVEGLFAFARLVQLGIEDQCNVGAILGSAMTEWKAERLIHHDEPVYLLFDNDDGGDIGIFGTMLPNGERQDNGAIHYLREHVPLFIPGWPEGKDDPDDLTREELDEMIRTADQETNISFDKKWGTW